MHVGILKCGRVADELRGQYGDYPTMLKRLMLSVAVRDGPS